MPLIEDEYVPATETSLYNQRSQLLQNLTNGDIEDFEGSIIQSILQAEAELLANNQEQSLSRLHDAAFLESAEGEYLDKKVQELGISRNLATPSTGVATFTRDSVALNEFIIQKGTAVTTENGTVDFETTEKGTLDLLSGFDNSSLDTAWNGDTSSYGTTNTYIDEGTHSLEIPSVDGANIWRTDVTVARGDTVEFSPRVSSNNTMGYWFGVRDNSNYYEIEIDKPNNNVTINEVLSGAVNSSTTISPTIPTDTFFKTVVDVSVQGEIDVQVFDGDDNSLGAATLTVDYERGGIGVVSKDANSTKHLDTVSRTATTLNIEALNGGEDTNVGADRVTVMPSPPTGVTAVTNPVPTGDRNYFDSNDERLVVGTNREEDESLRERAIKTASRGGAGTARSIFSALSDLDNVIHVDWNENDTLSSNNGLPPLSIEFIVYGGTDADIAEALHLNVGVTERLTSGVNGNSVSFTYTDELLDEEETYEWSEPPFVSIDITVDIVVEDTYEGDDVVKSTITQYVGGTDIDGGAVNGLGIGEDILHDDIRDILVGDELGVRGVASIEIDGDGDGTDDSTTNANGLKVYEVADNEVPETDATDGSITVTTTTV